MPATGATRLGVSFLRSHTEAQVASICRTHADDPERTREFVEAIRQGVISLDPAAMADRVKRRLIVLGVPEDLLPDRAGEDVQPELYPNLSPQFLRGRLPGQIDAVYRDRESNPTKVGDFLSALRAGFIPLAATPGLRRSHLRKLIEMGHPVERDLADAVLARSVRRRELPQT